MQIYISSNFSKVLENKQLEIRESFSQTIEDLKEMNKTQIINSDAIVEITHSKGTTFYAYYINNSSSFYILFTFLEKNKLVLLDLIKLLSDNEIESFVYEDQNKE